MISYIPLSFAIELAISLIVVGVAPGEKGIFVGYSENSKGYRIYVVGQREVKISHDVTFDENMAPIFLF